MPFCPNCDTLKNYLKSLQAPFMEMDLEDDDVNVNLIYDGVVPTEAPLMKIKGKYFEPSNLFAGGRLNTDFIQTTITGAMNGFSGN